MAIEPNVTITPAALQAFRNALGEAGADDVLRLSIDPRFKNELYFGPREPNDVVITTDGVTIAMDGTTARRANGLAIDFVETSDGPGFKLDNPNQSPPVKGILPAEVRTMLERGERFELVDVRPASERTKAKIDAARPLDEPALLARPKDTKLVFMGHHSRGGQSTAHSFFDRGFTDVSYVVGGIDAWSTMEPSVPRY